MTKDSKAVIVSANGEWVASAGGRISTQEGTALGILSKSHDTVKNANLIEKVTKSGHNSTIEHCYYNVAFEDVSVFAEQFIIEFRLASFTVKSRRYVDFSNTGYYIPESLDDEQKKIYCDEMDFLFKTYSELCEGGVPKEDARFVLPYCLHSNFICSVNAREMLHIISEMLYGRGKNFPEIVSLGSQLLAQVKLMTPGIAADFETRNALSHNVVHFDFPDDESANFSTEVELIDYTENAEKKVAAYALTADGCPYNAAVRIASDNTSDIIHKLITADRPRALEFASYTFRLCGMSLSTLTHLTRHRMQSLIVPSLTTVDRKSFLIPVTVAEAGLAEKYMAAFNSVSDCYSRLKELGVSEEDLVYVLLSGNLINVVCSMNARELLLFFRLRTCTRAQWEIRGFAEKMLSECRRVSPEIFKYYGPSCVLSGCPEGRFSCGKAAEMKKKYS